MQHAVAVAAGDREVDPRIKLRRTAGWKLGRWALFYLAMLLADAAVVVVVVATV